MTTDLLKHVEKHFRFRGERDSLPYHVKGRRVRQKGRNLIARVMHDLECRVGVEVGTRFGESAKLWCEACPGLKLTCVDPYGIYRVRASQEKQDAVYEEAQKTLAPFDVTFVREPSMDAVDRFANGSLDFVHIDGNHEFDFVMQDIIRYVPKVRKGGLVLIHDYFHFYRSGVLQAVDGYTTAHVIRPWFVTYDLEPTAFWQRGAEQVWS